MMERFLKLANVRDGSLLDAAIITPGGIEEWRAYGANTCNNGHSTTKLFTAIAIGLLWDGGALRLDESVTDIFPEYRAPGMDEKWFRVTVETALMPGIGRALDENLCLEGEAGAGGGARDCLEIIFGTPLPNAPDTDKYSDAACYLLSRIVEKKSGVPMDVFLKTRLSAALQLRDFAMAGCPQGHTLGGGCMYMRASDMAKAGYMLACGGVYGGARVLSGAFVERMKQKMYCLKPALGGEVYEKAGAYGQHIQFSARKPIAFAWHRAADPDGRRDDSGTAFDLAVTDAISRL